jgi:hypothetical protein
MSESQGPPGEPQEATGEPLGATGESQTGPSEE